MSNTPVPVSIAGDETWGPSFHAWYPPDVFDMSASMDWPVGAALNQHALAGTVLHRGQALVLEGHDLGLLLPHVGEDLLARPSSSRKPIWSASKVRACGKPVACLGGPKLLTMMLCGAPIKFAAGVNDSNHHYNVFVGMSDLDYFKGWIAVGAEFVKDTIAFVTGGDDLDDAIGGIFGEKDMKGALVDAAVDLGASVIVSHHSGWEEPIGAKLQVGLPASNVGLEVKWTPGEGWVPTEVTLDHKSPGVTGSATMEQRGSRATGRLRGSELGSSETDWTVL